MPTLKEVLEKHKDKDGLWKSAWDNYEMDIIIGNLNWAEIREAVEQIEDVVIYSADKSIQVKEGIQAGGCLRKR